MAEHPSDDLPPTSSSRSRLRIQWRYLAWFAGATAAALVVYLGVLIATSPSVDHIREARASQASVILAADGTQLGSFQKQQQKPVTLEEVSPEVVKALIATEDHRFYDHHGVDVLRTIKAVVRTVQGDTEGGSTLTQQLARNFFSEEWRC